MADLAVKKGMDINLAGAPASDVVDAVAGDAVTVYPREYRGMKPRLLVKEGDKVKRGSPLFFDKMHEAFRCCSPAAGTVETIAYGARRVIEQIVVRIGTRDQVEAFPPHDAGAMRGLARDDVIAHLFATGYIALIEQRPFSRIPDSAAAPKSIFVNAASTAPFCTDIQAALPGHEAAFQAGLDVLSRLTDGPVHLVLPGGRTDLSTALTEAAGVEIHRVTGPHPAGNPSVHIHRIDPISPGDTVWCVRAPDAIQIGRLFLDGAPPRDRVISVGGPAVREDARKHYRVRVGGSLDHVLNGHLLEGETRILNGDVLGGSILAAGAHLPFRAHGITVIAEDRSREFLGWLAPGLSKRSHSRLFLSTWVGGGRTWDLGSSRHGSLRAMVMTGLYDRFMPINIMVDYLVRAVLANDTDEAIKLGILETVPEDFALCAFACPSKMDLVGIIQKGLDTIKKEGL